MQKNQPQKTIALVIFGITGDLSRRKLMPAIYQLQKDYQLAQKVQIIGFARRPWSDKELIENIRNGILEFARTKPVNESLIMDVIKDAHYIQSRFDEKDGYIKLNTTIENHPYEGVIFYLATPPNEYLGIITNLGELIKKSQKGWLRLVVEKPYGSNLKTAIELENTLHKYFQEEQIFRIDHYLGKETVQNILVFRFANGIFEPIWNNHYIDHIQITVAENAGIGTRAGYFENAGVIRDMFANHLLQLLTLTAMEAPFAINADSVRDEKMKVLHSLKPITGKLGIVNSVRGQYARGQIDQNIVVGYKQEDGVSSSSTTETYLALKIHVDNWRWAGVPFYIRSGKCMPKRATEIAIHFKQIPLSLFGWRNMAGIAPNALVLRLQPDEGISLTFGAKRPGFENEIAPVTMDFCYQDAFGINPPEAYERLLLDCLSGDATLFTRSDEVLAQWAFTQGILDSWEHYPVHELPQYYAGTWGPLEADEFMRGENRKWRNP